MSEPQEQTTAYDPEKMRRANGIRRLANRLGCFNPNTICDRKPSAQAQSL